MRGPRADGTSKRVTNDFVPKFRESNSYRRVYPPGEFGSRQDGSHVASSQVWGSGTDSDSEYSDDADTEWSEEDDECGPAKVPALRRKENFQPADLAGSLREQWFENKLTHQRMVDEAMAMFA